MKELNIEGMAVAPGVLETIVSIAVSEVDGVACVGPAATSGLMNIFGGKPSPQGIDITANEEGQLQVTVHVDACYGYVLTELAAKIRSAVADAVAIQVGLTVASVDIYIDGVQFQS